MIAGSSLFAALHALSTGYPDRALNIVTAEPDLDEALRGTLYHAIDGHQLPWQQAEALGDALRDVDADQFLVNECYRAAFYLGDHWSGMADNALYAQFLANRGGRVLDKWVHYFPIYHRHLERYRRTPVRVLEIGVYRGGGLDLWRRYLGPQARLVGLDIDEAAVRAVDGKYPVVLADQEDPEVLRKLEREYGPFDVVIDDGGHTMGQQIASADTLFPLLNDGGTYIVEDTHTSYWSTFGGGLHDPGSFVEWTKHRVDDLHSRHHVGIDRRSVWATDLDGVHIYDSVVVLSKQRRFRPFNEIVGSSSYLFADRFSEGVGIELLATRDAAMRERDELRRELGYEPAQPTDGQSADGQQPAEAADAADAKALAEELRLARAELQRSKQRTAELSQQMTAIDSELASTRGELLESWAQVSGLRRTVSWRVTKPLRAMRRLRMR